MELSSLAPHNLEAPYEPRQAVSHIKIQFLARSSSWLGLDLQAHVNFGRTLELELMPNLLKLVGTVQIITQESD